MFILYSGIFQQQTDGWTPQAGAFYVRVAGGDYVRIADGSGIWAGEDVVEAQFLVTGPDDFLVTGPDEFLVI